MSHSVPFGQQWEAITQTKTGAATITINNKVLSCSSVAGDNAKATRNIYLKPGETLVVSCLARRIDGVDATSGGMSINVGGDVDHIRVTSKRFKRYTVKYHHSHTAAEAAFVNVNFGVFTADAGTVEFTRPTMEISLAQQGALRTVACALLTLNAGAPSINAGFTAHGIKALAYDAASKKLTVTLDKSSGASYSSPLFDLGMTYDGNGLKVTPKWGGYSAANGTVGVMFVDSTTGAAVDIATLGTMYMKFEARI